MSTGTTGVNNSSSSSSSQTSINSTLAQLAGNAQEFLTLLTTQLQNQDPLNPLDTNQFTSQLTQMSGVEQQLLGNQLLQTLVTQQGLDQGANLIGKTVTATPDSTNGSTSTTPITGVVSGVSEVNGETELTVGSTQVPLSNVTAVSNTTTTSTQ